MKTAFFAGLALALTVAIALPALAKTKKKARSGAVTGIACSQGSESVFIGVSQLKPSERRGLRIGQRAKIRVAGVGPVDCVVR
jgi:cold shock CspA family protein